MGKWAGNTSRNLLTRLSLLLTIIFFGIQLSAASAYATQSPAPTVTRTPAPTVTRTVTSANCQKVLVEVSNADKIYVALQYGIIKAAQNYLNSAVISNLLIYNGSFIKVLQAANVEYKFATSNSDCFPAANIAKYNSYIKSNLASIASVQNSTIYGKVVGQPKAWLTYKPIGLLH